ncbi:MAG: hypothetical protein V3S95_04815, partial [Alphaproteobacteria bacterium]
MAQMHDDSALFIDPGLSHAVAYSVRYSLGPPRPHVERALQACSRKPQKNGRVRMSSLFRKLTGALAAAAVLGLLAPFALMSGASAQSVLKVKVHADLKNIDPIWTTAYITRNHGYMVYDTLFAMNESFEV